MSNNLSININQTPIADIQKNSMINSLSQFKVAGLDEENAQTAVELKISKLGRLKLENSAINANKDNVKKSGEVNFAIIRCGYGSDIVEQDDTKFEKNVSECESGRRVILISII